MAGVGFQLRKFLQRDTLTGDLSAYVYAGIISAGPLILSILAIFFVGVLSLGIVDPPQLIVQFQVSVTYLIACSLVITGAVQLLFTRFISDRLFQKEPERLLPNYNGVMLITTVGTAALSLIVDRLMFQGESLFYRILMMMGFIIVSNIWIGIVFLASLKRYSTILLSFLVGYAITAVVAVSLSRYGLEGLMSGFVVGHLVLLLIMTADIQREHIPERSQHIALDILDRRFIYPSLILVGVLFNLGVWLDKFMFWFSATGQDVIGPLRASVIYDLPIFISYLCIIPGMAVFLLRLETDFADSYNGYFEAVRSGGSLSHIREMRDDMLRSAKAGLYEILKIQALVTLFIFAFGAQLLETFSISILYLPLLKVHVMGASLQVLFLACLNIFLYLDRRRTALFLCALFTVLNGILTWMTLAAGPDMYGYGFAGALLITVFVAAFILNRSFDRLEYETYMLQKV